MGNVLPNRQPNKPQEISSLTSSNVSCDAPIGLFDSGIGGLSVYLHLQDKLPNERYVYYADTLNMPYGARAKEDITRLTLNAVSWLVGMGCKVIVIACNSASAHALDVAREQYPNIPIVGLVPALKPAVLNSQTKQVAVLATQATLEGRLLNEVIDAFATPQGVQVMKWFDPRLVPWVEMGMDTSSVTAIELIKTLHRFAEQNVDYLVLGCTHYPFFREFLNHEIRQNDLNIHIIDSGAAVALRVHNILRQRHMIAPPKRLTSNTSDVQIGLVSNSQFNAKNDNMAHPVVSGAKLAFFITDPKTNLSVISTKVKRLLYG